MACVLKQPMVLVLLSAVLISEAASLAVMSIDLGNEFIKIGIVKPGVPMEIVLNTESSRKTSTIVAMRTGGDREFANAAMNTAGRFPSSSYAFLRELLAKNTSNPIVVEYQKRFPYYKMEDDVERATMNFEHPDGVKYSVEELLAMILEAAKNYATVYAEQKVSDAVIICPAYFNQAERRALKRSAELAGIKVLQLMNSHAAVALNYGVFRYKEFNSTAQNYMFFDMGSTSTTAAIVSYQVVKMKVGSMVETNPQLTVRGVGFDRNLGSLEITLRIRDHLANLFNGMKKTSNDVLNNPRSMAKLHKEAERVKKILSANAETFAQVENLLDDQDFKVKVTRDELEAMCADLFEKIAGPVEQALKTSEMTMGEISEVILMGGGTRAPKVQEMLQKVIGREELGKSINTDEAAALGAVYQAAYLSTGFRVKTFAVKDANIYPIQVEFERTKVDEDGVEATKVVKRTLFNRLNPYPQKKVMTFNKHTDDFTFNVNYGDMGFLSESELSMFGSLNLTAVELEGVKEQIEKHVDNYTECKGVKAHFKLDESGLLQLDGVEVVFERMPKAESESTFSKLSNTISNFFGSSGSSDEQDGNTQTEETTPEAENSETDKADTADEKNDQEPPTSEEKPDLDPNGANDDKKNGAEENKNSADDDKSSTEEDKSSADEAKNEKKDEPIEDKQDNKTAAVNATEVKPVSIKRTISTKISLLDSQEPDSEHVKASRELLMELTKKDEEKMKLAAVQNELEAFSYDIKNKLYEDDYEVCSTEEERDEIRENLTAITDWYDEQGPDTPIKDYEEKLSQAKKLVKKLFKRVSEYRQRPQAMEALKSTLNHTKHMLKSMKNYSLSAPEGDRPFTDVELTTLETLHTETKEWMKTMNSLQKSKSPAEVAAFTVDDVSAKISALDREVKYLLNKAKTWVPKKPKVTINTKNTTKSGNKTDNPPETDTSDAADQPPDEPTESPDVSSEKEAETQEEAPPKHSEEGGEQDVEQVVEEPLQLDATEDSQPKEDEHVEL